MNTYLQIDLSNYYNSKIFFEKKNIEKPIRDITNIGTSGEIFDASSLPTSVKNLIINDISFKLPSTSCYNYDAISCESQEILIPKGLYSEMAVLSSAFHGSYHEVFDLSYDDLVRKVHIDFLDCWHRLSNTSWKFDKYNGKVALECKEINNGEVRYIYYSKINLPETKHKLLKIILPYNPNSYVFSISLRNNIK